MEEIKSENLEVKRPWQSYVWIGLNMVYFIFLLVAIFLIVPEERGAGVMLAFFPITSFFVFFTQETFDFLYSNDLVSWYFYVLDISIIYFFYTGILFILNLFFILNFLKGNKKIVYVVFFISLLRIIPSSIFLLPLFLYLPNLYLEYFCLNHPFYNQKINKT